MSTEGIIQPKIVEYPPTPSQTVELKASDLAPVEFEKRVEVKVCSFNICANGHKWVPLAAVGKCRGCNSPVLAVRMENCPICNEPVDKMNMRMDHMPGDRRIAALCMGESTSAEVSVVDMARNHAKEIENASLPSMAGVAPQEPK